MTKKSPGKNKEESKKQAATESYTQFYIKSSSTYVGKKLTERLVKDQMVCTDTTLEVLKGIDFKKPCEECIRQQQLLVVRRFTESELVEDLQNRECEDKSVFGLNTDWATDWTVFINYSEDDVRVVNRYLFDYFPAPGAIQNKKILQAEGDIQVNRH